VANLDRQLDALARDLEALDEDEARRELDEVEARIAADNERAARLRLILHVKQTWTSDITIAMPNGKTLVIEAKDGRKPKTRDAIVSLFQADDDYHSVRDVRRHLRALGIDISAEAVRQALRRLVDLDVLASGKTNTGSSWYKLAPTNEQPTLGADQE
jgi:hypothetical protein